MTSRKLRPELRTHFYVERAQFDESVQSASLAKSSNRIKILSHLCDNAIDRGNDRLVMDCIELAEKIDGGAFKRAVAVFVKPILTRAEHAPIRCAVAVSIFSWRIYGRSVVSFSFCWRLARERLTETNASNGS